MSKPIKMTANTEQVLRYAAATYEERFNLKSPSRRAWRAGLAALERRGLYGYGVVSNAGRAWLAANPKKGA